MHLHVVEASGLNTMRNQSTVVGSLPFSLFGLGPTVNPIGYTMYRIKQRLVMQTLSQHNHLTTFFLSFGIDLSIFIGKQRFYLVVVLFLVFLKFRCARGIVATPEIYLSNIL